MSEVPSSLISRIGGGAAVGDYVQILKPRVMSLVVFTGFVGLVLAPGHLHPVLAAIAVLCIAVGAGASGAINMWYDRDIDAVMRRTAMRPLPAGRMLPGEALGFGVVLAVGSVVVMGLAVNWAAAALLALTIAFYVFIYTIWLKRRTPQNIVIGGAAGALYAAAGIPMLPVVAGLRETKRQMLLYTLMLWPVSLAPWLLGLAGPVYAGSVAALSLAFTGAAIRVWRDETDRSARQMFAFSLLYLFLIFSLLLLGHVGGGGQ